MIIIRNNWTKKEIKEIYNTSLMELVYNAATIHRQYHHANQIKISTLISVKTGACPEDCAYCSQSSRYKTFVDTSKKMSVEEVVKEAKDVKNNGVERVCLSASWRKVPENKEFDELITMIRKIKAMNMEVCCTLGMLNQQQAEKLAKAGITAYNHNIDTSQEFYQKIITTRNFSDRIGTIKILMNAGIPVCSGGIIGMGEDNKDRISMIHSLSTMEKHPYTVPLNSIISIEGTPMQDCPNVPIWDMIRMIATVRITMPVSMICLAAGRSQMNEEGQALCFMAGANSIFAGTRLLTTPNPTMNDDMRLLKTLGLNSTKK